MGVEITCLPNGLNVLTHAMPHIETVALGIWVKAGARDERPEENGIAHFLEHMAFKGTKRRTAKDIAEEIEFGGRRNQRLDRHGNHHLLCPRAEGRLGPGP